MFIIVIMAMFCVLAVAVAAADSFGAPAQHPPRYSSRRAATPVQTEAQKAAKADQREAEQAAQKAAREAQKAEQARARKAAQRAEEQRRAAEQAAHKPEAVQQDQPAQQAQQPAQAAQQPPRAADEYTITPRGTVYHIRPDGTRERLAEDDPICARVKADRAATSAARAAFYAQQQPAPAVRIAGKALAFTGTIPGMKRSEAIRAAERAGARGSADLTTDADILVIGSRPGKSKLDRAERWNLPTITADQFIAALAG
jgi:colicin import membrane protein